MGEPTEKPELPARRHRSLDRQTTSAGTGLKGRVGVARLYRTTTRRLRDCTPLYTVPGTHAQTASSATHIATRRLRDCTTLYTPLYRVPGTHAQTGTSASVRKARRGNPSSSKILRWGTRMSTRMSTLPRRYSDGTHERTLPQLEHANEHASTTGAPARARKGGRFHHWGTLSSTLTGSVFKLGNPPLERANKHTSAAGARE